MFCFGFFFDAFRLLWILLVSGSDFCSLELEFYGSLHFFAMFAAYKLFPSLFEVICSFVSYNCYRREVLAGKFEH